MSIFGLPTDAVVSNYSINKITPELSKFIKGMAKDMSCDIESVEPISKEVLMCLKKAAAKMAQKYLCDSDQSPESFDAEVLESFKSMVREVIEKFHAEQKTLEAFENLKMEELPQEAPVIEQPQEQVQEEQANEPEQITHIYSLQLEENVKFDKGVEFNNYVKKCLKVDMRFDIIHIILTRWATASNLFKKAIKSKSLTIENRELFCSRFADLNGWVNGIGAIQYGDKVEFYRSNNRSYAPIHLGYDFLTALLEEINKFNSLCMCVRDGLPLK
jgi:hypothetical protein